jgi:hypothetical protein
MAQFCVADGPGLAAALLAAGSDGSDDVIRLRNGSHTVPAPADATSTWKLVITDGRSVNLSGGWNAGCSTQSPDPGQTVLNAFAGRRVLDLSVGSGAVNAVSVLNLRLTGGSAGPTGGAALAFSAPQAMASLYLERLVVNYNSAPTGSSTVAVTAPGGVRVRNSLFAFNVAGQAPALRVFGVGDQRPASFEFANNTVVLNQAVTGGSNSSLIVRVSTPLQPAVWENNVFWDNQHPADVPLAGTFDFELLGGLQRANVAQRFEAAPGLPGPTPTRALDPRFAGGTDFSPRGDSPLRNAGVADPSLGLSSHDAAGQPRLGEGQVDIGALESPVLFSDGFD